MSIHSATSNRSKVSARTAKPAAHKAQTSKPASQTQTSQPAKAAHQGHGHDKLSLSPEALAHMGEQASTIAAPLVEGLGHGVHMLGETAERAKDALRVGEWGGKMGEFAAEHGPKLKGAGQIASGAMTGANLYGTWVNDTGSMHHKIERTGEILGEAIGTSLGVGLGAEGGALVGAPAGPVGIGVGAVGGGIAGGAMGGKLGSMWGKDVGGLAADWLAPEKQPGAHLDIRH